VAAAEQSKLLSQPCLHTYIIIIMPACQVGVPALPQPTTANIDALKTRN
jgi:hypothetical protein